MSQSVQQAVGAAGDQFYITHCTTTDSVLNNPGYTVRAASTMDPDALDSAFHYPPYELPIDMWRDLPSAENAPCRLARTEHPDGGVWAVHSSYVAKDTVDRDRSYFSHLLHLPFVDPAAVLRSWGAGGWARSYPQGAPKKLEPNARLPVGSLVSDVALTAFLNDDPTGPTELSITVCPMRLRASTAERRELFARMLHALLLSAEEGEGRCRLYIHAEPGLVALLLYGAVRLLPPVVTENLTFSTFEPYHRNLREYKLAEVVGTYLGHSERGLDAVLGTTHGVALDTFDLSGKYRRSSPELRAPLATSLPTGVAELVELAAQGEWNLLPAVRHAVGADPDGLHLAGPTLIRERGLARVDEETADITELLRLQEDRLTAEELLLPPRADKVWKVVKKNLARPDVRRAFGRLLGQPERIKELWDEAFEGVLKEDYRRWELYWTAIREAASNDETRKLLSKVIGSERNESRLIRLPTDVRARLRTACTEIGLLPPRPLLVPVGLGEVEPLLSSAPDCSGYSAFVLMAKDELGWLAHVPPSNRQEMRQRAREFLYSASPKALAAYVHAARDYLDSNSYFLDVLFKPHSPGAAKLMDKLLSADTLEPGDWLKLCRSVKLTQDQWGEYLLEKDRLASLLFGLRGDEGGKDVWDAYLGLLTPALISPDLIEVEAGDDPRVIHEWEQKVHNHLRTAAERLTKAGVKLAPALPEGGVAKLFAANNLLKWADDPASADNDGWGEVNHACAIFELDPLGLVSVAYRKGAFDQCDPGKEAETLAPIVSLFQACFPVDANFNTARRAAREIVRLSHDCPAPTRGALQALFLQKCVPDFHYPALLEAEWHEPLQPYAVSRLQEWISRDTKKSGVKYAAPSSAPAAVSVVEAPIEGEEENEEGLAWQTVIQKRRRSRKQSKLGMWVLVVVMILAAIGLAVFAAKRLMPSSSAPGLHSPGGAVGKVERLGRADG